MANRKAIYTKTMPISFKGGKWQYETTKSEVRVMAVAEGYAMVRYPRCSPFCVREKDLEYVK